MPQWASSIVPEGALLRQINNKEQEKQHHQFKSSGGIPLTARTATSQSHPQTSSPPPPPTSSSASARRFSRSNLVNAEPSPLVSLTEAMEKSLHLKRGGGETSPHQRQWNSTNTNPVHHHQSSNSSSTPGLTPFQQYAEHQLHLHQHQNNNQHLQQSQHQEGNFLNNIQFSQDPVTANMKQRALAATGTFGAKPHILPMHVRSVVSTLRRNVDEMKRFAAEIPILTTVEMPSATKRLAALLYAQTIAVDDLCRFTEDELKFASGKFYDLVSQMMELQCGKEDKKILESILKKEGNSKEVKNMSTQTTSLENDRSSTLFRTTDEQNNQNGNENENENDDQQQQQHSPLQHQDIDNLNDENNNNNNNNDDENDNETPVPYFAEASAFSSPKLPQTHAIRELLLETSPSREIYDQSSLLDAENNKKSTSTRTSTSLLGLAVKESQKELNSFRCLYSMLAGVANITGASEGRLFLFPSEELLATSRIYSEKLQQAREDQQRRKREARSMNNNQQRQQKNSNLFGDLGIFEDDDGNENDHQSPRSNSPRSSSRKTVMESLDPERLYLIAQVQAQPFAPVRSATAPHDIVKIAEAVASTRCAANLTPGIARVRASFESLVAVPLFVSMQPESAVLGVLVLTNKRLASSSSSSSGSGGGQSNSRKQAHSHFDNSNASSTFVTRGFFHDDEHKAVIAAEMMSWLVEKVPTGVVMRGAVRLSPSGFAEEWSHWTGRPPRTTASYRTEEDNNDVTSPNGRRQSKKELLASIIASSSAASSVPVLDPQMALLQVPRRRFVFRTEDPREVAATGRLKLQVEKGFSQATTSSSGGGDVHVNSRRSQVKNFAKMTKTRALIGPESGEYLIDVAQSHRKMEDKTDELENEVCMLRRQMAELQDELEAERGLRKQAEDAAHSMQVACDRIVRKSIFANSGAATHSPPSKPQSRNNTASSRKRRKDHQRHSHNAPRPPSSGGTPTSPLFEKDLANYASASRPYSKTNVGIRRPSSTGTSNNNNNNNNRYTTTMTSSRTSSRPSSSHSHFSTTSSTTTAKEDDNGGTGQQQQQQLLSIAQIMAATNVPFDSKSSKSIPSFHATPSSTEDQKRNHENKTKDGRPLSKVQMRVRSEEKKTYY